MALIAAAYLHYDHRRLDRDAPGGECGVVSTFDQLDVVTRGAAVSIHVCMTLLHLRGHHSCRLTIPIDHSHIAQL